MEVRDFPEEELMNWVETPMMERLECYLDLVTFRHELVSSNLANVDTPGYHTQDIDFEDEMRRAEQLLPGEPGSPRVRKVKDLIERPDGNNVSLERETLSLARVQLQYRAGVELLRNEFHTLQSAINEGKQ
jgi:flagellar basal-body rod protein FlgB